MAMNYYKGNYRYDDCSYLDEDFENIDEWCTVFFDTFDEAVEYAKKSMEHPDEFKIDVENETAYFSMVDREIGCSYCISIGKSDMGS